MGKSSIKWFGRTLAGLSAAALSTAAIAEADLMDISSEGGLNVGNKSGPHWFTIDGRAHVDYTAVKAPNAAEREFFLGSGMNMRRLWMNFSGGLGCDFSYTLGLSFEPETFASNSGDGGFSPRLRLRLNSTFINYKPMEHINVAVGQINVPATGIEGWSGNNHTQFLEASLPVAAFAMPAALGVYADGYWDSFTVQAAAFTTTAESNRQFGVTNNTNSQLVAAKRLDDKWGFAGRLTMAPWNTGEYQFHLGVHGMVQDLPNSIRADGVASTHINPDHSMYGAAHIFPTPEARGRCTSNLISSRRSFSLDGGGAQIPARRGFFRAKDMWQWGVEAAALYRCFHLQGEYIERHYDRQKDWPELLKTDGGFHASKIKFKGAYASAGWVFCGGERTYDPRTGTISNPVPDHCCGAWEANVRWSRLDLRDQGAGFDNGECGVENNFTFGVNWFLNHHIKVAANYVHAKARYASPREIGNPQGAFDATVGNDITKAIETVDRITAHFFGIRLQAAF